jgi:hypothetical protein
MIEEETNGRKKSRPEREIIIYRTRAAAGIGSACGLGAGPTPDPREPARAVPTYTQIPPGCAPRLQWGSVVAWSSTAATTGFVRGHRTPGSSHDQQLADPPRHPPQIHTYVQTVQSPTCVQVQSSLLKASTTNLTGPVATPAPCGVIPDTRVCILQPAWINWS